MNTTAEGKLKAIRELAEQAAEESRHQPYMEDQVETLADFLHDVLDLMKVEEKQTEFQFGDVVRDKGARLEGDIINVRTVNLYTIQMKQLGHWFEVTREEDQIEKVTELPLRMGSHIETPEGEIGTVIGLSDTEALVEYDNEGYDYFSLSSLKRVD